MAMKWDVALIIGGSVAGLLAARVLSDFYSRVIIVEKDLLPDKPVDRLGTPQAFHPHRITMRGKTLLNHFFPDYEDDLVALGAPTSLNKKVYQQNQYGTMTINYTRNDIKFSRATLEYVLRERIRKMVNIQSLENHDVLQLLSSVDPSTITGILARDRTTKIEKAINADLVIDASGRFSKLTNWLTDLGYNVPAPDEMKADIGYSTRRYKLPPHLLHLADEWDVINISAQPKSGTFHGVFSFIEHNVAETLLYRPGGVYPPTDPDDYEKEIAQLPDPLLSEIISELEPITDPRGFRVPVLYRQRFEQMVRWPSGLLVLGDAFSHFDPIFGQGMTVAAMEAEILHSCLSKQQIKPHPQFEHHILQKFQDVIEPAWWLNCATDLQWEGVLYESRQPLPGIEFGKKYMDLYLNHAIQNQDWKLYGMYWAVNTLGASPDAIFNAETVVRILSSSQEGQKWLNKLLEQHKKPINEILNDTLPSFSSTVFQPIS